MKCMICDGEFTPKTKRSKTCDNADCKKKLNRITYNKYWKKLDINSKREKILDQIVKGNRYSRKFSDIKTLCKCPGCSKMHIVSLEEPGWTGNGIPRIRCSNWPYCARKESEFDCDETNIPEIFEYGNRASL